MTQEEKARRYDEALAKAKEIYQRGYYISGDVESIFPELIESEDERIRKELIDFVKSRLAGLPKCDKYISWLEKQKTSEETLQYLRKNHSPSEISDFQACIDWLEKQGGQNPYSGTSFEYDGHIWSMCAREGGVEILIDSKLKAFVSIDKSFIYPICTQTIIECINEEKVDNKNCVKPTDKPKFHEGDWCIDKEDGTIFFIKRVLGNTYKYITNAGREYSCTHYSLENDARLWTISDAKDGDVLQLGGVTAIFKEYIGNGNCKCYCSVFDGEFEIPSQDGDDNSYGCIDATPATKEQRDKLEKAMAEADYEFDFEKKELKKIEDKHICELDNSYTCVKFPFKAKVKSSGKIVTIHGGQLSPDGREWRKYQSDAEDGYKVYEPNNLEEDVEYDGEDYGIDSLWHAKNILEKNSWRG